MMSCQQVVYFDVRCQNSDLLLMILLSFWLLTLGKSSKFFPGRHKSSGLSGELQGPISQERDCFPLQIFLMKMNTTSRKSFRKFYLVWIPLPQVTEQELHWMWCSLTKSFIWIQSANLFVLISLSYFHYLYILSYIFSTVWEDVCHIAFCSSTICFSLFYLAWIHFCNPSWFDNRTIVTKNSRHLWLELGIPIPYHMLHILQIVAHCPLLSCNLLNSLARLLCDILFLAFYFEDNYKCLYSKQPTPLQDRQLKHYFCKNSYENPS